MNCPRSFVVGFAVLLLGMLAHANVRSGLQQKTVSSSALIPKAYHKTPENSHYLPDRVIVKLRSSSATRTKTNQSFGVPSLDKFVERYSAESIEEIFRHHALPASADQVDLTKFYVLRYSTPIDAFTVAKEISQQPDVEYAEPWFVYEVQANPTGTPNDTAFHKQWDFTNVKVDSAWDITQGDSTVVLAIDDTGVQWSHPDLAANIWNNPGEIGLDAQGHDKRTNGIDDDGNGQVDDWHGWDFGGADFSNPVSDNDASPTSSNNAHGTHVAGITSAVTNNVTGVAGMGYKCKILPIKTTSDNDFRGTGGVALIVFGYEGIIYAAEMGAAAVNCSWGGEGYSQFEQDVVNYAASKGTLVVAAAGNGSPGNTTPFYPASYANVISVAATDQIDAKTTYSNYGPFIDVCAPGGRSTLPVYNTFFPNTYGSQIGTSMSAPHVTGLAGLVKARFPSYHMLQVGEQMRVTCDDISAINNTAYIHQLGKGRINALRAVTDSLSPSLRVISLIVKDSTSGNNNGIPERNETVDLLVTFGNYLQATGSGATITMTSADTNVQILASTYMIGSVGTLQTKTSGAGTFQFLVKNNTPPDHIEYFTFNISDGSYDDFETIGIALNPSYQTHDINNVQVTFTREGKIGFNDFPNNSQGAGFMYGNGNQLFEGGLLVGYSSTKIVDVVRNEAGGQNADFVSSGVYSLQTPGAISDQDGGTAFTDNGASITNKVGVSIKMSSYAYANSPNRDYVIVRYEIKNTSGADISSVYAGLFFDWDMLPPGGAQGEYWLHNRTSYDAARDLGYAWYDTSASTIYCGTRVLTGSANYYGLYRDSITASRSEKWSWLSSGVHPMNATGDIHFVVSSGPYNISNGATQAVGFALIGGVGVAALQQHADAALATWNEILTNFSGRPRFTIAIHQNPAFTQYADMFVTADSQLASVPVMQIDEGVGSLDTVVLSQLPSTTVYKGPYQFMSSGTKTIRVFARTVGGTDTIVVRIFQAQLLKAGIAQSIREPEGRATLNVPAGALAEDMYFIAYRSSDVKQTSTRLVGDAVSFGPGSEFTVPMTLEFSYTRDIIPDGKEKYLHLFQHVGGEWVQLESSIDMQQHIIRSVVHSLGEFSVGIGNEPASTILPAAYALFQNYPNPFNPSTEIRFALPERGKVRIRIFNVMGQEILTLVDGEREAGVHRVAWNGGDALGQHVASGMYFYRLDVISENNLKFTASNKMLLLK